MPEQPPKNAATRGGALDVIDGVVCVAPRHDRSTLRLIVQEGGRLVGVTLNREQAEQVAAWLDGLDG